MKTHPHNRRLLMVCTHVHAMPEMVWIENGRVEAAFCLECAHAVNAANANNQEPPESIHSLCAGCAGVMGLPTTMAVPDGFYERHDGEWLRMDGGRAN